MVFDATSSIPQCYMGRALEQVVPSVLHYVMASCTAKVGLLAAAEKSYIYCCCFVKRRQFLYNFEVSCQLADMLLLDVDVLLGYQPPTIGPHWVPVFCCGLTTPSIGVAWALGLWWWIETKAQMMVYRCLFKGTRV